MAVVGEATNSKQNSYSLWRQHFEFKREIQILRQQQI